MTPTIIYGAETWATDVCERRRLDVDVFEMTCSGGVYTLTAKETNGGIRRCESNVSVVR